ncbi:hypothetical protein [Shewanella salipaludis]|uniref:Uncharacterized protein n=1 Tax=Shewanella salipaludis TaxID=2723052 RepID=A0A972FWS1_9GAMM|nr:hypothetical protein [Shewanella salipaludis]NMH66679.1 hypothetical protein [Shewanella salipaludis]
MKKWLIISSCLGALLASTQTSGLLRSVIELAAFGCLLWLVLGGQRNSSQKTH